MKVLGGGGGGGGCCGGGGGGGGGVGVWVGGVGGLCASEPVGKKIGSVLEVGL